MCAENSDDVMLRKPDVPAEDPLYRKGDVPPLAQKEFSVDVPDPCPYLSVKTVKGKPVIEVGLKGTF